MGKNITLNAEESHIQQARELAARNKTTLNALFREWLARYIGTGRAGAGYTDLMERLAYGKAGRHVSRNELNER